MALLRAEPGEAKVAEALEAGAAISVVNWAEVLSKLAEHGKDPAQAAVELRETELAAEVLAIEPLSEADCVAVGQLRLATKAAGLSLADRACLVLAERLGVPALTADRGWEHADLAVEIRLIR